MDSETKTFIASIEYELFHGRASSFEEFRQIFSKRFPTIVCKEKVDQGSFGVFVSCAECSINPNSALCIHCFMKGNHKGHHVYFSNNCFGCCDCGDPVELKEGCFCSDHMHKEVPCEHLTKEEKELFSNVFTKVGKKLNTVEIYDLHNLIQWIISFNDLGDEVMDCVISTIEPFITKDFVLDGGMRVMSAVVELLLSISKIKSAKEKLIPKMFDCYHTLLTRYRNISTFTFSIFKRESIIAYVKTHPNWVDFVEELLNDNIELLKNPTNIDLNQFVVIFMNLKYFLEGDDNAENRKKIAILYAKALGSIEYICSIQRVFGEKKDNFSLYNGFVITIIIEDIMKTSKNFIDHIALRDVLDVLMDHISYINACRCPADTSVTSNCLLPLHAFLGMVIKDKGESCIDEIISYGKEKFGDVTVFIKKVIELPLRYIALLYYTEAGKFVRNDDKEIEAVLRNITLSCEKSHFIHIFSLIQICCGIMDKEEFVKCVINHFTVDYEEMKDQLLHFLTCIIFDRACLADDEKMIFKTDVFYNLLDKPLPINQLSKYYGKNNGKVSDMIREFSTRIPSADNFVMAKNSSDVFDTYSIPWFLVHKTTKMISKFEEKNKNALLPIHDASFETSNYKSLKLAKIFETESFNALVNDVLQSDSVRMHLYALSVIIEEYQYNMIAKSPLIDIEKLLASTGPKNTLKDVIKSMNIIGEKVLKAVGVQLDNASSKDDFEEKKRLRRLQKEKIMNQYKMDMDAFVDNCDDDLSEDEVEKTVCPACQMEKDDVFVYPFNLRIGPDAQFESTFRVSSCMHAMHLSCFKSVEKCPLDRSQLLGFMPKLIDVEELTPAIIDAIHEEFNQFDNPVQVLLIIIFNELYILLARHEINKECFKKFPENMLRNIFLILEFYLTHEIKEEEKLPDFTKQIRKMMMKEKSYDEMFDILLQYVNDTLLCHRLTLLFNYYCLNERKSDNFDFESALSVESIRKAFPQQTINDTYLNNPFKSSFDFMPPKAIIEYAIEPYNIKMGYPGYTFVSLLSGKMLQPKNEAEYFDIGICASGPYIGAAVIATYEKIEIIGTPYLNMYGEEDIGLNIGLITYLDDEKMLSIVDKFLAFF